CCTKCEIQHAEDSTAMHVSTAIDDLWPDSQPGYGHVFFHFDRFHTDVFKIRDMQPEIADMPVLGISHCHWISLFLVSFGRLCVREIVNATWNAKLYGSLHGTHGS